VGPTYPSHDVAGLKTDGMPKAIVFIRFQKRIDDNPGMKCECGDT
jgi:hypothetical protein